MSKLAFIGGSGIYDPAILENLKSLDIFTPYGRAVYDVGTYKGREFIFMARHGAHHSIPPHEINYRANIYALKKLGVTDIISTAAVGSLNPDYKPGELVLLDQFIDLTKSRAGTFYDGRLRGVAHIDMTEPYCAHLRKDILKAGKKMKIKIHPQGTYICTEGPRFETPAEIKAYRMWGADVVGMTNVPECQLAREAEICYATISMVTNFAAGISKTKLTHSEVLECMEKNVESFRKLTVALCEAYKEPADCDCHHASAEYGGFSV